MRRYYWHEGSWSSDEWERWANQDHDTGLSWWDAYLAGTSVPAEQAVGRQECGKEGTWRTAHETLEMEAVVVEHAGPACLDGLVPSLWLVSASYDMTAKLWCPNSGVCLRSFVGHTDAVMHATFSPDGTRVLTAGYDGLAKIWSVSTGKCTHTFDGRREAFSEYLGLYTAFFLDDGGLVLTASADGGARIWDVAGGRCIWALKGADDAYLRMAVFAPSGREVLTSSADHTARVWDITTKSMERVFKHEGWVNTAIFSEDGSLVLTSSADATARLWNATTQESVMVFRGHWGYVRSAVFAGPGQVLTCASDWCARLWSMADGACVRVFEGHESWVNSLAVLPDLGFLLTASRDHTIKLWRTDTGACELTLGKGWDNAESQGSHSGFVTTIVATRRCGAYSDEDEDNRALSPSSVGRGSSEIGTGGVDAAG